MCPRVALVVKYWTAAAHRGSVAVVARPQEDFKARRLIHALALVLAVVLAIHLPHLRLLPLRRRPCRQHLGGCLGGVVPGLANVSAMLSFASLSVSSVLGRLGLSPASDAALPPCGPALSAGAHVWCLAHHGSYFFAGDGDGAIHVWRHNDVDGSTTYAGKLEAHAGTTYALLSCADTLVSAGADGLCSWRLGGDSASLPQREDRAAGTPEKPVLALTGGTSDLLFSSGADGRVTRWSIDANCKLSSTAVTTTEEHVTFYALAMVTGAATGSAPGAALAVACAASDGIVRLWSARTLELLTALHLASASQAALAFFSLVAMPTANSGMGGGGGESTRLLLGGTDNAVRLLDVLPPAAPTAAISAPTPTVPTAVMHGHGAFVSALVAISPRHALSADLNGRMIAWDLTNACAIRTWEAHASGVYALAPRATPVDPVGTATAAASARVCSAASDGQILEWTLQVDDGGARAAEAAGGAPLSVGSHMGVAAAGMPADLSTWHYERHGSPWVVTSHPPRAPQLATPTPAAPPPPACVWSVLIFGEHALACGTSDGAIIVFDLPPDSASNGGAMEDDDSPPPAQLRATLRGHTDAVHGLAWLAVCGLLASCAADGSVRVWDVCTMRCVATLLGHVSKVLCCFALPSAHVTAQAHDRADSLLTADASAQLCLWRVGATDAADRAAAVHANRIASIESAHEGEVYALAAGMSLVASAGADHHIRLWQSATLTAAGALPANAHTASIFALAVLPPLESAPQQEDGEPLVSARTRMLLASADASGVAVLWDMHERVMLRQLSSGGGSICALLATGPGELHAAGGRGELYLWRGLDAESHVADEQTPMPPCSVVDIHDAGILSLSAGRGARVAHVFSGSTNGHVACCALVAPTPPLSSLTKLADENDGDAAQTLRAHVGCVWALAASDASLFSGGADGTISVWAAATPEGGYELAHTLQCAAGDAPAGNAALEASGTVYALLVLTGSVGPYLLAAIGDGSVQLWHRLDDTTDAPNEVWPTTSGGHAAHAGWHCIHKCDVHSGGVLCLAESDGFIYAGAADCAISKLQLSPGTSSSQPTSSSATPRLTLVRTVAAAHQAEVHAIAIHERDNLVSAGADGAIRVWSLPLLQPLYSLRAAGRAGEAISHDGAIYALLTVAAVPRSSNDDDATPARIFSASADTLIKVWDLGTMDQLACLAGHQSFVCALCVASGCLYSASSDKTLGVWSLATYARLRVLTGHRGGLYSLTVREGRACSGSLDGTIRVWTSAADHDEDARGGEAATFID